MAEATSGEHWWSCGLIKNGTSTEALMICQDETNFSSHRFGIALNTPLSLLLLEQPLLFVTSHALHFFLGRLGQSLLVSQIAAGILLGPSLLVNPDDLKNIIPPVALYTLQTISRFGFILYFFIIGVKTDISALKRTGSMAIAIAFSGFSLSLFLGFTTFHFFKESIEESSRKAVPQLIVLNSLTFFMVTSHHLHNLEISNTELGRLASCVALVLDASAMFMDVFVLKFLLPQVHYLQHSSKFASGPFQNMTCVVVYYIVLFFGCRPLMILIIKQTPIGTRMKESHLMLVLLIFFAIVFVSECISQPVSPYLLGLSLPNAPFGAILADKLEGILTGLFLPIFCAVAGLRANFKLLTSKSVWLELVFFICYVGKLIGTIVASMLFKLSFSDALAIALIVCSKGLMEIATLLLWRDEADVNIEEYSVLILHILLVTKLALPLARRLYDPSRGYKVTYDRRTIQESFETNNLKILTCIYEEDNITTLLKLLESSAPPKCTTLNIIALHLVKLTGHSMPFREPLHLVHKSVVRQFLSEHTLNAFYFMSRRSTHGSSSRVQHYMATSPYKTMYNDVCSLAHEWRINFIIVPFHKKWSLNQKNVESMTSSTPIREVNKRVLEEAPCVVGVLVDRAKITNKFYYHVAMLFVGGTDDHEALAYCRLLANHPKVRLTMLWLRETYDATKNQFGLQNEGEDDVRFVRDFQYSLKENQRVCFIEEYVSDGIETTQVVLQLGEVDLVVTGRWHDPYSPVISGFNDWSECAELGTLGDMLASPEFRCSVLVIQRQPMIAWIAS